VTKQTKVHLYSMMANETSIRYWIALLPLAALDDKKRVFDAKGKILGYLKIAFLE
jgi:hypothetical protein